MRLRARLTVELTDERIRVTDESGAIVDEPAAIVLCFKPAQPHRRLVLAVGKEAAVFSPMLTEFASQGKLSTPPERVVLADRAPWWPPRPGEPLSFTPAAHENECLTVWPSRDVERDGGALVLLLRHEISRSVQHLVWSTHLDLTDLPFEPSRHDAILRACWEVAGRDRVTVRGQTPSLKGPGRAWREVPSAEMKRIAGGFAVYPALAVMSLWPSPPRMLTPLRAVSVMFWPYFLGFGLLILASELRKLRTWVRS